MVDLDIHGTLNPARTCCEIVTLLSLVTLIHIFDLKAYAYGVAICRVYFHIKAPIIPHTWTQVQLMLTFKRNSICWMLAVLSRIQMISACPVFVVCQTDKKRNWLQEYVLHVTPRSAAHTAKACKLLAWFRERPASAPLVSQASDMIVSMHGSHPLPVITTAGREDFKAPSAPTLPVVDSTQDKVRRSLHYQQIVCSPACLLHSVTPPPSLWYHSDPVLSETG